VEGRQRSLLGRELNSENEELDGGPVTGYVEVKKRRNLLQMSDCRGAGPASGRRWGGTKRKPTFWTGRSQKIQKSWEVFEKRGREKIEYRDRILNRKAGAN